MKPIDKITIPLNHTFSHIKCQSSNCSAEFVLMYAKMEYDEYSCTNEPYVLEQEGVNYCPYCGKRQNNEVIKEKL